MYVCTWRLCDDRDDGRYVGTWCLCDDRDDRRCVCTWCLCDDRNAGRYMYVLGVYVMIEMMEGM